MEDGGKGKDKMLFATLFYTTKRVALATGRSQERGKCVKRQNYGKAWKKMGGGQVNDPRLGQYIQ